MIFLTTLLPKRLRFALHVVISVWLVAYYTRLAWLAYSSSC
uniref:Uncharacterized protein n=1 Tax=Anguilla anguilla TaxID=7936 RepID=A0A0E9QKU5_ANGAN